ncbi:endonuclease subunit [uncultured Caudovirales phage]|uniref:Endonuclease subunit n=1 Tax=uncultured Caudovirales phage TaxID=2100421 RepID=A0A6J5L8M3_9CAUD|nr:endonuclease subunit [uncultured Caudovirales phage]
MIKIKNLTIRNFLSSGNATQAIKFDRDDLTLVLGENLDLGSRGSGNKNGVGKTCLVNAISYALYGAALNNIKKDNLINRSNAKNMLVMVEFDCNGNSYKIERGRRPNIFKFFVNGTEQEAVDNSQGDSRETQQAVERLIGMSHDMFKHIVLLTTYTEPFLSLRTNDQRIIIEQLLGITLLSEKADKIKEQVKHTKELIQQEEFKIRVTNDANTRTQQQISSLQKRQKLWVTKQNEDIAALKTAIENLTHLDVDVELQAHRDLDMFNAKRRDLETHTKALNRCVLDKEKQTKLITKLVGEIAALADHKCYACGGALHDSKQSEIKASKDSLVHDAQSHLAEIEAQIEIHNSAIAAIGVIPLAPTVFYDTLEDALNHKNSVETLTRELATKSAEVDPYTEQIHEMENVALVVVDYETLNELTRLQDHQEFLLKLLSNKDSFVRKKIIEQNLSYLNARLTYYLDSIGLPHTVIFQNDLSVEITEFGRELDFYNLSRGEMTRLILALNFAFRDVWESLYSPINLLFIDELVDNGIDHAGSENILKILKKMSRDMKKSIWLISHKDEFTSRVDNIFTVIKENGFTEFAGSEELAIT